MRTVGDTNSYLLENMKPNTRWSIYVTSHGSVQESGKSNVITMETGDKGTTGSGGPAGEKKGGGGMKGLTDLVINLLYTKIIFTILDFS